ncbi:MAG TPA: hypothetical protein VMH91_03340 [Candidatus Paceibacterota bacterium]|nr:hypothetical protein [Candidatus Paceibacterota bacterium]
MDENRRVVVLEDANDYERDRQQLDPTSEPAPGHPKYSSSITIAEMPAAPGEVAPEIPAEAPTAASPEEAPQGPPFEKEEDRVQTQAELRGELKRIEGTGVNPAPLIKRIDELKSPAAAEKIKADIEVLSKVRSPLRSQTRPPWAR